jgi:hypothetical protein
MNPNTLDYEVPPLKSNTTGGWGRVKSRLSVQQTSQSLSCRPNYKEESSCKRLHNSPVSLQVSTDCETGNPTNRSVQQQIVPRLCFQDAVDQFIQSGQIVDRSNLRL